MVDSINTAGSSNVGSSSSIPPQNEEKPTKLRKLSQAKTPSAKNDRTMSQRDVFQSAAQNSSLGKRTFASMKRPTLDADLTTPPSKKAQPSPRTTSSIGPPPAPDSDQGNDTSSSGNELNRLTIAMREEKYREKIEELQSKIEEMRMMRSLKIAQARESQIG